MNADKNWQLYSFRRVNVRISMFISAELRNSSTQCTSCIRIRAEFTHTNMLDSHTDDIDVGSRWNARTHTAYNSTLRKHYLNSKTYGKQYLFLLSNTHIFNFSTNWNIKVNERRREKRIQFRFAVITFTINCVRGSTRTIHTDKNKAKSEST